MDVTRSKTAISEDLIPALQRLLQERLEHWPEQWERYHWPGYTYDHTLRVQGVLLSTEA